MLTYELASEDPGAGRFNLKSPFTTEYQRPSTITML